MFFFYFQKKLHTYNILEIPLFCGQRSHVLLHNRMAGKPYTKTRDCRVRREKGACPILRNRFALKRGLVARFPEHVHSA